MPASNLTGLLIVISAPSGCGKTTIVQRLLERNPKLARSVTATTRKPRKGEIDGKDYFFLTGKEFFERRRRKDFLEWALVFDNYYGTLKDDALAKLKRGKDVILAIDVQGARQVRKKKKMKGVFIFLMPPSVEDLKKRLFVRKSESNKEIQKRLEQARIEMSCAKDYDYIVTNRYVSETLQVIEAIIAKEKKRRMQKQSKVLAHSRS